MRTGDIRSIPVAVWPLLGLALLNAYVFVLRRGLALEIGDAPSIFLRAAPFLFAALIAFRTLPDKRFLWGALALCTLEASTLLNFLLSDTDALLGLVSDAFGYAVWALTFGGLLLIGRALGGVRTRAGQLGITFGALVFVASEASYVATLQEQLSQPGVDLNVYESLLAVVTGLVSPTVHIGWGYLLGAALENARRYTAIGAGLILTLAGFGVAMTVLAPATPGPNLAIASVISLALRVAAWTALIVAALTEFGPRRYAAAVKDETPAQAAA